MDFHLGWCARRTLPRLGCRGYLRYVDDLLLFADDKPRLWRWREQVMEVLERLRLTVHPGVHPRPVAESIPFLGFQVFPERRRLKRRKGVRYQRHLRKLLCDWRCGASATEAVVASLRGWCNHIRYANTVGLRQAMLQDIPDEIRERLV